MKRTYILALCAGLALTTACRDKFLDLRPISEASSVTFYKTASDLANALSGAYSALQLNGQYTELFIVAELPSDDTFPSLSGSVTDQDEFDKFYLRTTNPYLAARWNDGYRGIYRANTVIDRSKGVEMNQDLKARYVAEAQFLRALMYFNLVRVFGDVPLVVKEIEKAEEGYLYGRSPAAEVYAQIIQDLTEAEAVLPVTYPPAEAGRATQGAAKALLGKVYLTLGRHADAAGKLKEVIDLGVYDLLPSYADVFAPGNKNHKESVFAVQYKKGSLGEGNRMPNAFAPENSGNAVIQFGGDGQNRPHNDLLAAYEPGDPRKDLSTATSYKNARGETVQYNFVKKYYDVPAVKYDNDNNFPVIRYADVLLMYAEALNAAGYVPDGEAFTALNRVRQRVGLPAKTATDLSTQAAFRDAVLQERRVELAFEGHRWFDLVRTSKALEVLQAKAALIGIRTAVTADNLLFPIPQSQIDINPTKIEQNRGY
jgi:hypothetical protein